jgi:hypothetical protein
MMVFQVIDPPVYDLSTPEGQLLFITNKLYRLQQEIDPANRESFGPGMSTPEQLALIEEMVDAAHKLNGWVGAKRRRETSIAAQLAKGALPWLAIKHIMLERGFTHVQTMGGPQLLTDWPGPYGNGIPEYYHGLLRSDLGPGYFSDCDPDPCAGTYFVLGAFVCIKQEDSNDG